MEKLFAYSHQQVIVGVVWTVITVLLINYGGRNNNNYIKVVRTGFWLIVIGAFCSAALIIVGTDQNAGFTSAATNFMLILSGAVGANYISHAKMSLRPPVAGDSTPEPSVVDVKPTQSSRGNRKQRMRNNKS